ncbi:hypothetical protein [Fibrobacter sp.]|uniref:hypothetical protein n=1 Tax=Fibrobacter sp. TaxID=35828 RepID=UPI00262BB3D0|nr:hypothetical protein [Fibrobacter sp.]MDD5943012.1 hypothetical protein [Fibrobacter sp.]
MKKVILNALFDNLLMLQPCRENFTLCCKSDIPPIYTYSSPFAPPNFADRLLTRDPGYPHISHILPGTFCHIANSNNGWAWVYNSSCQGTNLQYPCYWDILAENYSNGITTLSHLIEIIAQHNGVRYAFLPDQVNVIAKVWNNTEISLHIYANYDSIEYSGENKPTFRNGGNRQTGMQETALAA